MTAPEQANQQEQGKRNTQGRPVLTDADEKKRQKEESRDKPVDPE